MIENLTLISQLIQIEKKYSITLSDYSLPLSNSIIGLGKMAYIITSESEKQLRTMTFGFTPHWAKEKMNLLTARAEGDKNKENDPFYNGPNSIFLKPAFKRAIQHYRCLVVADGFTCNVSGKEIQIFTTERPSVLAGIYDYWKNPETGIIVPGFALITVPSTGIIREAGIQRMPVIFSIFNCTNWIRPGKSMSYYLPMLDRSLLEMANAFTVGTFHEPKAVENKPVGLRKNFLDWHKSKREKRGTSSFPDWGEARKLNTENQTSE